MAKGDTLPPARSHFSAADDYDKPAAGRSSARLSYACRARGCPMPGTLFPGGADDGVCFLHFGCNGDEMVKVSQALADWQCVVDVVLAGRRFANNPATCSNPKAADAALAAAWSSLLPAILGSGWKQRLEVRTGEHFVEWSQRLSRFLANRAKERLRGVVITDDDAPTPVVAEMLAGLRAGRPTAEWPG